MHVAILTATSAWGGVETHVLHLAAALRQRGHKASIVELGHNFYQQHAAQTGNIPVQHLDTPCPVEQLSFMEARQLLRRVDCDVAVLEKGDLDAASWHFDMAARLRFKRYITIEQLICDAMPPRASQRYAGGALPGLGLWWYRMYWKRFARSLGPHVTVCVSEAVRSRLIQDYGFPQRKTVTVSNSISVTQYRPNDGLRAAARRAWNIPGQDIVIGAVGRLAPVKGYDVAIEAFKDLRQTASQRAVWLVIVGDGPSRAELENLIKQHRLEDCVKLPGATDQPWTIYPGFDVFVMPSLLEGLPHALLEAMACGCPAIAFDVGGVREIITDETVGWLVADGDRNGFSRAMRAAVNCPPQELATMATRARALVCARYDAEVIFDHLANIIQQGNRLEAGKAAMKSTASQPPPLH